MIKNDCPLIFTHIPKTGGMSMFASMCEYHGMQIADMYNMSEFHEDRTPVETVLRDTDMSVYAGHFPFGLHEWLSRPSSYMAIVRKPLDRITSLYNYTIQYRESILRARKETGQTLQELFGNRIISDFYVDFIPWLKGGQSLSRFLRCTSPELDNGMVRRFSGIGMDTYPCPGEALDLARENIENYYSVVGVQERYQDTVHMARTTFGENFTEFNINRRTNKNQAGQKPNLDMRRRIKEMNRMDTELYDWILDGFDDNLANPKAPIIVPGGGRTDFGEVKLWRAIGSSPMRQGAMEKSPANQKIKLAT